MKEMLRRKKSVNERQHIVASVCVPLFENLEKRTRNLTFWLVVFALCSSQQNSFLVIREKKTFFDRDLVERPFWHLILVWSNRTTLEYIQFSAVLECIIN